MRRRKNLIPLTLDNVTALPGGRAYTVEHLAMIFDGTPAEVEAICREAVEQQRMCISPEIRGFRRTYWVPAEEPSNLVATKRTQAAEMAGELRGYVESLRRFSALCMAIRRA